MDNQHKLIKGYRDLSQYEIDLMNEIKAQGEVLSALVKKLQMPTGDFDQYPDQRWVSIGMTDLQKGLMALTRAVAKPTSF